jgi:hypothetical protein
LKKSLQIALVAAVAFSAIPYRTITVPAWRIRFTDESGAPFQSLPVNQTWRNYSVETKDHHASELTDENGYAQFPKRSVWAPLVMRVLGPIGSILGAGVHASFGPSGWIMTSCDLMERGSRLATYYGTDLPVHITLGYFDRGNIRNMVPMSVDPRCKAQEEQAIRSAPKYEAAILTAFAGKAYLVRQVAADQGIEYDEAPVPGKDQITFSFKKLDRAGVDKLVLAMPKEVFAKIAIIGGGPPPGAHKKTE